MNNACFRALPSVDFCLARLEGGCPAPHDLLKTVVNGFLDECRTRIKSGEITDPQWFKGEQFEVELELFARRGIRAHFRRVLNGTGVVIHTNLGRSVLADEALKAMADACSGYSNLEMDLSTGRRGSRYAHVEDLLCRLTGAEAALVVNNNAAAVFLTLGALCAGREVVVARGQLVEIGGSFRIPDIMARSGVSLREVGCTNRVHSVDYLDAVTENTAALMRVHTSNYRVIGFHTDVPAREMAALAHDRGLLFIEDLGSGSLLDLSSCGLPDEPTVQSVVSAGADVVTFSGDKVLGGPQAGIIVGRKDAIARIKADPLNRALRIGKMTLAALEATLRLYMDGTLVRDRVPTIRMILADPADLKVRALRLAADLRKALGGKASVSVRPSASRVGGGAFPEHDLTGFLVRIESPSMSADAVHDALLRTDPPLIGRIVDDAFCVDVRTLSDVDLKETVGVVASLF